MCCEEVYDDRHSAHIVKPTKNENQKILKNNTTILQRPKEKEADVQIEIQDNPQLKTLQQRQQEYDRARERIFARIASTK